MFGQNSLVVVVDFVPFVGSDRWFAEDSVVLIDVSCKKDNLPDDQHDENMHHIDNCQVLAFLRLFKIISVNSDPFK